MNTPPHSGFPNGNGNGHNNGNGHHRNGNPSGYHGRQDMPNPPYQTAGSDNDEIDLSKLVGILWRYKWVMFVCLFLGTICAYFIAQNMTPVYKSEGKIMIQEMRNRYAQVGSDISSLMSTSFGVGMGSTLANELEVLRSRRFMEQVTENFMEVAGVDYRTYPLLDGGFDENEQHQLSGPERVTSRIRANTGFSRVDQETDVVNVAFESTSPKEAALIVNTIIDTYTEFSTFENRRMSREGLRFLQDERDEVERALARSEEDLRDFMNREGLVTLEEQSKQLINILTDLETESRRAQVEHSAVTAAIGNYQRELNSITPGLGEQIIQGHAPRIARLQYQISELDTERELLLSRNPILREQPEMEPRLNEIDRRINDLEGRVRDIVNDLVAQDERYLGMLGSFDGNLIGNVSEMRRELLKLEVREQELQAQMDVIGTKVSTLEQNFDRLPDNMVTYTRLSRNVKLNTELFVLLERQAAEVAIWEQTQAGFGRLLDYGMVPENPVSPRTNLMLMLGFMLGGIFGLAIIAVKELGQTTIMSVDKLREKGLQILAVVPDIRPLIKKNFSGKEYVTVRDHQVSTDVISFFDPISAPAESYRRMYNNIMYAQPDKTYQTLLVTSAGQSEGKTTNLSNLAVIMAESGHKVVLVDCDFRRPRLHREFGFNQDLGVSEWLFNENSLGEITKPTVVNNVDVLTAGKKVLNPANLVQSRRMKELIAELKKHYDFVLLDAPPYGIITDAAPLMRESDGVILVSRFAETRNSDLDHTIENLHNINANIIGTVLNGYDPSRSTGAYYYNDYYRYSYRSYDKYVTDKEA